MKKTTLGFQKFFCTAVSATVPVKNWRHTVRYALNPLNDKRCVAYFTKRYASIPMPTDFTVKALKELPADREYIWQCWLQGTGSVSGIVKNCMQSVRNHLRNSQEVIVITEENYDRYVALPNAIISKRESGIISDAQFSDLLRIYLLAAYGGYWIDATCFMTDAIPERISSLPFFAYHSYGEFAYTQIQSCFMHVCRGNRLVVRWAWLMTELWCHENRLLHYFQLHLMFKAMTSIDGEARDEYLRMPYISEKDTHTILRYWQRCTPFSEDLLNDAMSKSFIHKLTYKLPMEKINGTETFGSHFALSQCTLPSAPMTATTFGNTQDIQDK